MSGTSLPLDPSLAGLDRCGGCVGVAVQTPVQIANRGGLPAIKYRIGTHGSFKASLLARLTASASPALRALTTRDDSDATIALLDAAAVMADVVTFYQERIANESYLRTAQLWRSLAGIGRLVGTEPQPGLAATAVLAFTLETGTGAPESTTIPAGTRIQSVPAAGQLPQTFETSGDFTGRPEWNAMPVLRQYPQAAPDAGTPGILLQGVASQLRPGDRVLLLGSDGSTHPKTVLAATANAATQTTQVDFVAGASPVAAGPGSVPPAGSAASLPAQALTTIALQQTIATEAQSWDAADLLAFVQGMKWSATAVMAGVMQAAAWPASRGGQALRFRQRAAVFGHNAPAWDTMPTQARQTLVSGVTNGGTVGAVTLAGATITNATLTGATVLGAPIATGPAAGQQVPPTLLAGGTVTGGVVSGPGVVTPYPDNWDDPAYAVLDVAWSGNALARAPLDPNFDTNTLVPLDHAYPGLAAGGWVVLQQSGVADAALAIESAADTSLVGFTLSAKVTQLDLGDAAVLGGFTRRGTTLFCDSDALAFAPIPVTAPVGGSLILLDRIYLGLQAGQYVAVSGNRTDLAGVAGVEVVRLASAEVWGNLTQLTLTAPLAWTYDPQTVAINANVVVATHGMSVAETLGSGDATVPYQEFVLRQPPLTFVADPAGGGAVSTLQIRVNGALWSEVATLYEAAPTDRVYVAWLAEDGRTHVMFGDGLMGARLPTGSANVTAAYRTGIGTPGLVGAGAASMLVSRPLGVRSVANPLPSTGAADPDAPSMLRQSAPLHVLTLDRVVSLEDYANYALAYPGIGKALATWRWSPRGRTVAVTVAGQDGAAVDPAAPLGLSLLAALRSRGDPNVAVLLDDYAPVFFKVAAAVRTDPALPRDQVLASVQAALQAQFAFAQRGFGQPVQSSEVTAAIQAIAGVLDCGLTLFCRAAGPPGVAQALAASVPAPGEADPAPAEILLIDPRPTAFGVLA